MRIEPLPADPTSANLPDFKIFMDDTQQSIMLINGEMVGLALHLNDQELASQDRVALIQEAITLLDTEHPGTLEQALAAWPLEQQQWFKEALAFNNITWQHERD